MKFFGALALAVATMLLTRSALAIYNNKPFTP